MYVASKHVAYEVNASAVSGQSDWLANSVSARVLEFGLLQIQDGWVCLLDESDNRVAQGKFSDFSLWWVLSCPPSRLNSARSGGRSGRRR